MSTPNYYSNAGTVYAIDGDDAEHDFLIDDTQCYIIEQLREWNLDVTNAEYYDDRGSYGGRVFASVELPTASRDLYPVAELIIRSGYYAGANIDFNLGVYNSFTGETLELDELDDDIIAQSSLECRDVTTRQFKKYQKQGRVSDYSENQNGSVRAWILPTDYQVAKIERRINKQYQELERLIRKACERATVPLKRVATFSNGEAIYERM